MELKVSSQKQQQRPEINLKNHPWHAPLINECSFLNKIYVVLILNLILSNTYLIFSSTYFHKCEQIVYIRLRNFGRNVRKRAVVEAFSN